MLYDKDVKVTATSDGAIKFKTKDNNNKFDSNATVSGINVDMFTVTKKGEDDTEYQTVDIAEVDGAASDSLIELKVGNQISEGDLLRVTFNTDQTITIDGSSVDVAEEIYEDGIVGDSSFNSIK